MGTLAKKVMPQTHPSTQFVERIVEEVQQMSGSLDDIVWNISPKNDELTHLLARMRRYASEVLEARQINYELIIPEGLHNIKLTMDQRRNFYMIFKEAVNNLVKYSKCTRASVCIQIKDKILHLVIKDNGVGFDTQRQSDRNGLKNLRARSEQLKGKIKIESEEGKGTEIDLIFPIRS
jgi:signal transduction histidine kinase